METLVKRADELVRAGQRRKVQAVAEQLKALVVGASIEVEEARVLISGRGIVKSWLIDPRLQSLAGGANERRRRAAGGGWRFIAPVEGMAVYVKSIGAAATYRAGAWEIGVLRGSSLAIDGVQVVGSRSAAIEPASGGTTVDAQARSTIDRILTALRQHGLIETQ